MAVYEHIETGDRVRPSKGDRYEQLLRRSPLYRLVDAEGDPEAEPEVSAEPQPEEPKPSRSRRRSSSGEEEREEPAT